MPLAIKINYLNIYESYFKGEGEFGGKRYTIHIQNERRGKVVRFPFEHPRKEKVLVRVSGPGDVYVEDFLPYKGESDWIELDSDIITFYIADHQDQFDYLEIYQSNE
ncbi:MAG: hypothetical protein ACREAG_03430 [Nitrosopumilaceae archaeon]